MSLFARQCPGVYTALTRVLDEGQMRIISGDYERIAAAGGNQEPAVERTQGASFNPRIARILAILLRDAGVTCYSSLRAAMYCALHQTGEELIAITPEDIRTQVRRLRTEDADDELASLVRLVIDLDTIRHLHMTLRPDEEKLQLLAELKRSPLLQSEHTNLASIQHKLVHAIHLQERRFLTGNVEV